jgi:putative transposase
MEIYHVLNRGVDKRDIVLDDQDRARFLHDLFVFNDQQPTLNFKLPSRQDNKARKLLVYIHAFCLMPNHYHLLLSPAIENGISLFMKKLGMGYTKYFNERHARSGALWQGKYKRIHIARDAHFLYIPYYIHLNPLDLAYPEWRKGEVKNSDGARKHLKKYRWSSHLDYSGVKNFPSITHREILAPLFGNSSLYEKEVSNIITNPELATQSMMLE